MQGQGDTTELKERGIQRAIELNLRAVCANPTKWASRYPYHHLDLNCGSGWNERANCFGSPVAAVRAMINEKKEKYDALFCDINPEATKALLRVPEMNDPRCFVIEGDNHEVLDVFAERIRRLNSNPAYAMGTILCDPNGCFDDKAVPIRELWKFTREFPRIDLILNLNEFVNACFRGHVRKGTDGFKDRLYIDIPDLPTFLNRKYWMIRQPIQKNGHRFVMLIGRNFRMRDDDPAWGLHHLDSPAGQAVMERIRGKSCNTAVTSNILDTLCFE